MTTVKTDPKTLKRINYLLKGGDKQKAVGQTALVEKLLSHCASAGHTVEIKKDCFKHPNSPLPSNHYEWTVTDKNGTVIGVFKISRNIWPKSGRSEKGREFYFFSNSVIMVK